MGFAKFLHKVAKVRDCTCPFVRIVAILHALEEAAEKGSQQLSCDEDPAGNRVLGAWYGPLFTRSVDGLAECGREKRDDDFEIA